MKSLPSNARMANGGAPGHEMAVSRPIHCVAMTRAVAFRNRMNRFAIAAIVFCASTRLIAADTNDAVADFLREHQSRAYFRADDRFYSDDNIFRLDLDLNGDGQAETLISSSLDRDGKAGNVWAIYAGSGDALRNVGFATFNADHFYVGKVDEIGKSGLVTFRPAGGSEGSIVAYILENGKVAQVQLGSINREDAASSSTNRALSDKYLSVATTASAPRPTVIEAAELKTKYDVQVQPKTYAETLREVVAAAQNHATPTTSAEGPKRNGTVTAASAASPSESQTAAAAPPPATVGM